MGVVGGDRVGIRLSPFGAFLLGAVDDDSVELNLHLVAQLNQLGVTYIHCIEPRMTGGNEESADYDQSWTLAPFRKAWQARDKREGWAPGGVGDVGWVHAVLYQCALLPSSPLPTRYFRHSRLPPTTLPHLPKTVEHVHRGRRVHARARC